MRLGLPATGEDFNTEGTEKKDFFSVPSVLNRRLGTLNRRVP